MGPGWWHIGDSSQFSLYPLRRFCECFGFCSITSCARTCRCTISCAWFCFWSIFIHENPSSHPSISKEELHFIEQNRDQQMKKKKSIAFWKNIFTSLPMWALIVTHFGHGFGFLTLLLELPTYLSTALHFDLQSNGFLSSLPFIVHAFTAFLSSFIADSLRKSGKLSIIAIRKLFNSIGTLFAITNAIANLSGILGPLVVGFYTSSGATLANWSNVFYTTAAMYGFCGVVFVLFGSAELQPWCEIEKPQKPKNHDSRIMPLDVRSLDTRL